MNLEKRDTLNFEGDELEKLNTKKINMDIIRQKRENRNSDQVELENKPRNLDMTNFYEKRKRLMSHQEPENSVDTSRINEQFKSKTNLKNSRSPPGK